jgi:hypothetical protein
LTSGSNVDDRYSRVKVFYLIFTPKNLEALLQYTKIYDSSINRRNDQTIGHRNEALVDGFINSFNDHLSILSMCIVDTCKVFSELTFGNQRPMGSIRETQKAFYSKLAEELIDNRYNYIGARKRHANEIDEHESIDTMFDTPVRSGFCCTSDAN